MTLHPGAAADPGRAVGLRLAAWLVDLLLYVLVSFLTFLPLAERAEDPPAGFGDGFCTRLGKTNAFNECFNLNGTAWYTTGGRSLAHMALLLAWFLGIHVLLQGLKGGSLGKLATGVRVVREDGSPPGVGRALVRSLLWVVDGLPCCAPLVGLITMLSTRRKQRVGDLAAKTFVVRATERGLPVVSGDQPSPQPPAGYPQPPGYPPAGYPPAPGYPPAGYPPPPGYPPAGFPPAGNPPAGFPRPPAYPPAGFPPPPGSPPPGSPPPPGASPPQPPGDPPPGAPPPGYPPG